MYAVIATGGKQYRVEKGSLLRVGKLTAEPGSTVEFSEVLLVADGEQVQIGAPRLAGGRVLATVEKQTRSRKVSVVKFRRRKHYLRQKTHRQQYTELRVTEIQAAGLAAAGSGDQQSPTAGAAPEADAPRSK